MNINLNLSLFGWHISSFNIRVDLDEPTQPATLPAPKLMDHVSDYFASRYVRRRLT